MKKTLFVCQANVGRSQMAEGFFNAFTDSSLASSAGVQDFTQKYPRPTEEIITAMAEKGIDVSSQKPKVVTMRMCQEAAQIVVLCDKKFCPDFLLENQKAIFREVSDPHRRDVTEIRRIRDEIETIVKGLI